MGGTDFIVSRCPVGLDWDATLATGATLFQRSNPSKLFLSSSPLNSSPNWAFYSSCATATQWPPGLSTLIIPQWSCLSATNCPVHLSHSPFWSMVVFHCSCSSVMQDVLSFLLCHVVPYWNYSSSWISDKWSSSCRLSCFLSPCNSFLTQFKEKVFQFKWFKTQGFSMHI